MLALAAAVRRLHELHFGSAKVAASADIAALVQERSAGLVATRFSSTFLLTEWEQVVDAGSWRAGQTTAMWPGWVGVHGSPKRSATNCGACSTRCAPGQRGADC